MCNVVRFRARCLLAELSYAPVDFGDYGEREIQSNRCWWHVSPCVFSFSFQKYFEGFIILIEWPI